MSLSQNYGVLRVVQVSPPSDGATRQRKLPFRWFPEECQVCLLTRRETIIVLITQRLYFDGPLCLT